MYPYRFISKGLKVETARCLTIISTFVMSASLSGICFAQHTLDPRSVSQLSEVFDDAEREWTYTIQDEYDREPSLSDVGLVFVTGDSDVTQTIDRDGTIVWKRRAPAGMGTVWVLATPDGRFVRLVHLRDESDGTVELIASDGRTLWTKDLSSLPKTQFSSSGEYMLSDPNVFFPTLVVVFDTHTGYSLWKRDGRAVAMRDWGKDQLAFVENNTISSVDLTNGRTLWSNPFDVKFPGVGPGAMVWDMVSSENGLKLAVSVRKRRTTRIGVFDQTGDLLWRQDVDGVETPLGITPDGRFLATTNHRAGNTQLKLIDADTGAEIWTLKVQVHDQDFVIMNDRQIFSIRGGVLILSVDSMGRLRDQAIMPGMSIEYVGLRNGPGSSQDRPLQRIVLMLMDTESERTFYIESIEL